MTGPTWRRGGLAVLACALSLGYLFRSQLGDGFAHVTGDIYDGRVEITLLEHWYNVFAGREHWRQPLFFSPLDDTLGYNDGLFLYGVVYSGFRAIGADPFLASDLVNVAMRVEVFAAVLVFARAVCGISWHWAVLGASLCTVANNLTMQAWHAQLLTVGLAPLLGWLIWSAMRALAQRRAASAAVWGAAGAILFGAWLMTAFYMVWFTVFFSAVTGAMLLAQPRFWASPRWRAWASLSRWPGALTAILLVVALIPFLLTYLPTARETGMHPFADAWPYVPSPAALLNFGPDSLVYGGLDRVLAGVAPDAFASGELTVGLPLMLTGLAVAGGIAAFRGSKGAAAPWWRAVAGATAASAVLCIRYGEVSPWKAVYAAVPGAAAVRVVSRFFLFLTLPVTLLAMRWLAVHARCLPPLARVTLVAALVAEQLNGASLARLDRVGEMAMLGRVPNPPDGCGAFFIDAPRADYREAPSLMVNIDGMLVAEMVHRPTINGHASFLPGGFGGAYADPQSYRRSVKAWAAANDLNGSLCALDLARMAWLPAAFGRGRLGFGAPVGLGADWPQADELVGRGWSGAEAEGRWTEGPTAELAFDVPLPARDAIVEVAALAFAPEARDSRVEVSVNGHPVARWQPAGGREVFEAPVSAGLVMDGVVCTS